MNAMLPPPDPATDILPHNLDAEQELLGALFVANEVADIVGFLKPEHFHHVTHALIYRTARQLIDEGRPATPVTIHAKLESDEGYVAAGGAKYIASLARNATTVINAPDYASEIVDMAQRRQLLALCEQIGLRARDYSAPADAALQAISGSLDAIADGATEEKARVVRLDEAAELAYEQIDRACKGEKEGISTGIADLDRKFAGLAPQHLVILAARPSMGKSALAQAIALKIAQQGYGVLFFSLEMSKEELAQRALSGLSRVKYSDMRTGNITDKAFQKIYLAKQALHQLPFYVEDGGNMGVGKLRRIARRWMRKRNIHMIVVDYLQLVQPEGRYQGNKVAEIGEITGRLKSLAKELRIPVMALSQLSRKVEEREDKRPQLQDLRESGAIEQDADEVIFVYRDEYYLERSKPSDEDPKYSAWLEKMTDARGVCEVIIGKQRMGGAGTARIYFDAATNHFDDLSARNQHDQQQDLDL